MVDDRLACEFICDGIHLHPDIIRLITRCKGKELAVAITDAMEAAGMPDGKYQLGGQDVFVKEGAARLADGTLAGSTLTMIRAFQNLIRFGAAPEAAAPEAAAGKTFRCTICGYEVEADELPADYVCPICVKGVEFFEEV